MMRPFAAFVLLAGFSVASVQQPFATPESLQDTEADEYQFDWPIQRVAVIGAGPSGLAAYRELTEAGLEVRIFERDSVPGGNWHYTKEIPLDAPVPNAPTPISDFVPSLPPLGVDLPYSEEFEDDGKIQRDHRAPKPIWETLATNLPSAVQQFPQWPWPAGTPWQLSHYQVRNYVRSYASYLNINSNDANPAIAYNTRVEHIEKRVNAAGKEQGWRLWLRTLEPAGHAMLRATWWTEDFDAVAIAVGRYNAPSMPSIPGLDEWARRFPDLIRHSRQYRRAEAYANQTVLVVGASVSGSEISRDLNTQSRKIYQSFRPDNYKQRHFGLENELRRIPRNTTLVGEIKQFLPIPDGAPIQSGLVELKNGTVLSGIDSVILATGFRYTFPFLPQYYDGATYAPHEGSAATVSPFLPMDGSHIRDLYLDLFYCRDPTLAFISATLGTISFQLSDYTTLALAKVWTNQAKLPSREKMREWYEKAVEERGGLGKFFLFMGTERYLARVAYLIGWLNEAAVKYGGKQIDVLPKSGIEILHYWFIAFFGEGYREGGAKEDEALLPALGIVPRRGDVGHGRYDEALLYNDDW